jgi:hypothetical protein
MRAAVGTPRPGRMRHLFMGECEVRKRRPRGREDTAVDWESRRAEVTAPRAAELADPVQGFYLRHGRPPGRAEQVPGPEDPADEDEDPGTA